MSWRDSGVICGKRLWSKDEDETLKSLYIRLPVKELIPYFQERTRVAISHRARLLGITKRQTGRVIRNIEPLELDEFELGFAVGLFEGEGSVSIASFPDRKGLRTCVQCSNNSRKLLAKLQGCLSGYGKIYKRKDGSYIYALNSNAEKEAVLRALESFLITRKKPAQLVLSYFQLRRTISLYSKNFANEAHQILKEYKNVRRLEHHEIRTKFL